MTLPYSIQDREYQKFVEDAAGDVAIRVLLSGTSSLVDLTLSGMFYQSVAAGLTASITQSQGQQALTKIINEISTCANAGDVVTLMSAAAGAVQVVINNGAANLQIFPASGDDCGAGVDTAITVPPGAKIRFDAYDATNWKVG